MDFQKIANTVDEEFLAARLPSGLAMVLNPKAGYSKTMGILGVRFGSADNLIPGAADGGTSRLPDGTAHFLEHKLFEDAEGDVSDRFTANGAQCNASTGFNTTSYLFSCTEKVCDNLRLLLSFVQEPYFTEELVRKEQGIIQQEIKMYEDDPSWVVFFNLMQALYRDHPARHNIAGSVESIAAITPDSLDRCYRAFYRPGNMVLALVGDFDPGEVYDVARRDAEKRARDPFGLNERFCVEPDPSPGARLVRAEMIVSRPKFILGIKEKSRSRAGRETERTELMHQIILDALLSKSSPTYEALYEGELIDDSFSACHSSYGDFGLTMVSCDTDDPAALEGRLIGALGKAAAGGIDRDSFERIRNKYMGHYVRMFNSIESTSYSFVGCYFRGLFPAEIVEMISSVTLDQLNALLADHFDLARTAVSVVWPRRREG